MADYKEQGVYQEGNSLFDDIFAFGNLEVQNINVVGIITAKTFSGVDATSLKDTGGTVKIQATTTGATHSGRAVFYDLEIQNKIYDGQGEFGSAGKVLSSTGVGVTWANAGSLSAGSAAQVSVVDDANSNSSRFITFVDSSSGNHQVKTDSQLSYNPFSNTINTVNIVGDLTGDVTGTILTAAQTNITSVGTLTGLSVGGNLGVTGNTDIGTDTNDTLTISAHVDSDIVPSGTTRDLGGASANWRNGFFSGTVSANAFSGDLTGNVTATTLSGTLQTAAQTNITSVGALSGLTVDGNVILDNTSNYLHIKGALYDKDGESGANGEVLVSTGTQVDWKNPNTLTASNSIKITITESDTDSTFPITFSAAPGQSGGNTLLSDNQFTYNSSSNTVTAGTFSGSGASLTSLNASNLQSGTVADARIPNLNEVRLLPEHLM